jgi:hypothetical protein
MFLDLGPVGRARIWLDEVAESRGEPAGAMEDEFTSDTRGWFLLDEVSIELHWSRGEKPGYGLLGCTFVRSNTGGARLRVSTRPAGSGPIFDQPLSGDGDVVRWGLPEDFGRSVLAGAKEGLRARGSAPAGQLNFTVAACGEDGSDAALFQRLGHLCVRMLDLSIETDEDGAARLVREIIEGRA